MASDVWVGIDVSKAKVDVALHGRVQSVAAYVRDEDGLGELAAQLCAVQPRLVLLEATGGYERVVLRALHDAGLPVSMTLPVRARCFARSMGRHAKTDAIDAGVLARMACALEGELSRWQPRTATEQRLRALVQRRDQLLEMLDMERKRRYSASDFFIAASIDAHISLLKEQRIEVDGQIEAVIAADASLAERASVMTAVNGVGPVTAAVLLSEMPELGTLGRNEVAALAGVAPLSRDSGKKTGHRSIHGGRRRARKALYMAALVASRHNTHLSRQHARLVERGKPAKVALVAVMRKLLIHLNSLVRDLVQEQQQA